MTQINEQAAADELFTTRCYCSVQTLDFGNDKTLTETLQGMNTHTLL